MDDASRQALHTWAQRWAISPAVEEAIVDRSGHQPPVPPFIDLPEHAKVALAALPFTAAVELRNITFPYDQRLT